MAEIDDSGVPVDWKVRQGDAWPREPVEIPVEDADGNPVVGLIGSARLMVRENYSSTDTLGALDSEDVGSPLTVSPDASTVLIAAGALPTDDWPVADPSLRKQFQVRPPYDVEITVAATGKPDTIVAGRFTVLPQVTHG